jgi:hypothetical protein
MASLMDKILTLLTGRSKCITQGKRRFSENQYYNFNYNVYALHEISHAVSLRLYDDYKSITDKSIVIKKREDSHFSYRRSEDPNVKELYVDMMVCLSGFVSELELLDIQSTSAYQDILDWNEEAKRWLTHYSTDYIALPETEAEVRWNNEILNRHKNFQASMIRELLKENKDTIYQFVDLVSKKKKANDKEISDFLDNIIVPENVDNNINKIMEEASIKWSQ